ncbi:hypothetical protein [Chromatium okenii]|jgi:hypothetical protein|uniref:hypothetical protein n=1 Tax=Chromatium okenii TaxID=61644 RepID=UPI0026ED88EA|nr:hypothetical protein [Chromatium okenii]MBV5310796.1 hypothetical protein [Chromatium okenii]
MLESFTTDAPYHNMNSDIDIKHDRFLDLVIELLAEAEIDAVNATFPVDMYHLLSERCLDYVRALDPESPLLNA